MPVGSARAARRGRLPVAIPDSVVAQYNALQLGLSEGDPVSTWPDEVGDHDATDGTGTYRESAINGNPAIEFDGNDDYTSPLGLQQPFVIFAVFDMFQDPMDSRMDFHLGKTGGDSTTVLHTSSSTWRIWASSDINGSDDGNISLLTGVYDGNNSSIREDGQETADGDVGGNGFEDGVIGSTGSSSYFEGYFGLLEFHDGLPEGGIAQRESELANMWDITI